MPCHCSQADTLRCVSVQARSLPRGCFCSPRQTQLHLLGLSRVHSSAEPRAHSRAGCGEVGHRKPHQVAEKLQFFPTSGPPVFSKACSLMSLPHCLLS